ncbi:MAG TPA: response regulator [Spirochaetia bacterium]|nr:response regulator [Spirochaetia bacterium]
MTADSILLVDDDPLVLHGVARQLEADGFRVTKASSGKQALDRLSTEEFDLVVTDLVMDEPNGLDVLEFAKRSIPNTAVIILTGYGDVHAAIDALRLGADDYLLKPSDPDELLIRIRSSIERRRLVRSNDELGRNIAERTSQLEQLNAGLEQEIAMHKAARMALSRSLKEKEVLLREIQHRVKNNLATISGLINLQGAMAQNKGIDEAIASLKKRVRAIHLIYEKLYSRRDLTLIDYGDYIETLIKAIQQLSPTPTKEIEIVTDVDRIELDIDTSIPLGLISTELLSNALVHAFPNRDVGRVAVSLKRSEEGLILIVQDDGVGLPSEIFLDSKETLGFRLVSSLTEQMGGTIVVERGDGSSFIVRVPLEGKE